MYISLLYKRLDGRIEAHLLKENDRVPGAEHFYVKEFMVNRDDGMDLACVSEYDIETLESIRTLLGLPVEIRSAGRTPEYNSRDSVKGSEDSKHQYMFDCLDFKIKGSTVDQFNRVYEFLLYRDYTGLGRYPGFRYHMDRGYRTKLTEWDER